MVIMVQFNPELAKSTPSDNLSTVPGRPESMYSMRAVDSPATTSRHPSVSSRYSLALSGSMNYEDHGSDDDVPTGHTFTFIPPTPRKFYKRLVELCIQHDLEAMHTLPEDQEVSLWPNCMRDGIFRKNMYY